MKILFLGTSACDYSQKLQAEFLDKFDFDARRSSSVLIEGRYLIDCGEHTLQSLQIANVAYDAITDIFITHLHSDHYNIKHIEKIARTKNEKLHVWVRDGAEIPRIENVEVINMEVGRQYTVSTDFTVTGLLANHDAITYPQHLLLKYNKQKALYACDGAWFLNDTWYRLKGLELDFLVLDATCGDYLGDYRIGEHNTIPMIRLMLPSMKAWKTITEKTKVYLSHLAPSLHLPHKDTVELVKSDGLQVAYDGLQVEI